MPVPCSRENSLADNTFMHDEEEEGDLCKEMDISVGTEEYSKETHQEKKSNTEEENGFYLPPLPDSSTEETNKSQQTNNVVSGSTR